MAYKDKDRQREANRQAKQRQRAKGMTKPKPVIPKQPATVIPKRGLDIKTFEDLPLDVQHTIEPMSKDAEDKAKRTAIAIHYQHLFPDRYHCTGLQLSTQQAAQGPELYAIGPEYRTYKTQL